MFALSVSILLKPNRFADHNRLIDTEALPLLRKQKGFQDEITIVAPNGVDAVAISLWHQNENAGAYSRDAYPGLLKTLSKVVEGTPQVHTYEVASSTLHKIAAHVTA